MKTKVVKLSALAAITAVLGMGGLALTSDSVSAVTKTTNTGAVTTNNTTSSSSSSSSSKTTDPTPTPTTTTTTPTTTPNTGIFTGDGEFTKADGIIILTGGLAVILAGYALYHNRKTIFRGRVKFDRQ